MNNILLSGCITVYSSIHIQKDNFGYFQVLENINKAIINIHVHVLFGHGFQHFWSKYQVA